MDSSSDRAGYRVQMETRQWLIIDATMDNEVITEAQEGDPRGVVDLGSSIRQAGWDQIPGWPHDAKGFESWPAPGQKTTMTMTGAQWELVLSALETWSAVTAGSGDPDSADEVQEDRAIIALIRTQLADQGWSPR
ncbi:hypothetical protein D0T12_26975 [Actinomadura spongiicola]|uniref:Uncharacterized protein n=1 Tax=Actinomadura spongiicola TaxID=2303421 RepID=A0A372GAP2_9ACTN|nr:hypothetical protein [Actinomadura spongiicola]RFS82445.1 hypothetical protein D0T12_26975 [Actinomadura spongiicola]